MFNHNASRLLAILAIFVFGIVAGDSAGSEYLSGISGCHEAGPVVELLGTTPQLFSGEAILSVQGTTAYIGRESENEIRVVDFSNPESPTELAPIVTEGPVTALEASGTQLYAAIEGFGLYLYDVTNPAVPILDLFMATSATISAIHAESPFAYLAMEEQGLGVVSTEIPGFMFVKVTISTGGRVSDISAADGLLLAVDSLSGMLVYDLAIPDGPLFLSATPSPLEPTAVVTGFGRAVLVSRSYPDPASFVTLIDLTDASSPDVIGSYPFNTRDIKGPNPVLLGPDRLLVAVRDENDRSNLDGVVELVVENRQFILTGFLPRSCQKGLALVDGLMVGLKLSAALEVFAAGNLPVAPLATLDRAAGRSVVVGDIVYLTQPDGLQVLDLANPRDPRVISELPLPLATGSFRRPVAVHGASLYLGSSNHGLKIVDITDPTAPTVTHSLPPWDALLHGLLRDGDYLYARVDENGLAVYDLTVPAAPVVVGYIFPDNGPVVASSWVPAMTKIGDRVFIEKYVTAGVQVYDVSNPSAPALIDEFGGQVVESLAATEDGRLLIGFDGNLGLDLYEQTAPDVWTHTRNLANVRAWSLAVAGDRVFVNTGYDVSVVHLEGSEPLLHVGLNMTAGDLHLLNEAILLSSYWLGGFETMSQPCLPQPSAVSEDTPQPRTVLAPAWPNPFNPQTVLGFDLPAPAVVELTIHDLKGRHVRTLWNTEAPAGMTSLIWNGTDDNGRRLGSGVYFVYLDTGSHRETLKVALIK